MRIIRLLIQSTVLFFGSYFFIETYRLLTKGYILYLGKLLNSWSSLIFSLVVAAACEFLLLVDSVINVILKENLYGYIYLAAVIINAVLFLKLAYNSTVGTIICFSFFALLFIINLVNLILSIIQLFSKNKDKSSIQKKLYF